MNHIQVSEEVATEEQCLEFLSAWRWPNGVRCPICGSDKVTRVTRKTSGDNKRSFTLPRETQGVCAKAVPLTR